MKKIKTFTLLKFENSQNSDINELEASEVKSITPFKDQNGELHVFVTFYDEDFGANMSIICDSVEFKVVDIEVEVES